MKIPFITPFVRYFILFNKHTGKVLYAFLLLSFVTSSMAGIGLTLFVPLLSQTGIGSGGDEISSRVQQFLLLLGISNTFRNILMLTVLVFVFKGAMQLVVGIVQSYVLANLTKNLRSRFMRKLTQLDYRQYIQHHTGFFTNLVTSEIIRTVSALHAFTQVITFGINVLIYLAVTFTIQPQFTTFAILAGFMVIFLLRSFSRLSREYSRRITEESGLLQQLLIQVLHAFKYLSATNRFESVLSRLIESICAYSQLEFRTTMLGKTLEALTEPIAVVCVSLVLFYHVDVQNQPIAPILVAMVLLQRIMNSLMMVNSQWQGFSAQIGGVEIVFNTESKIDEMKERYGASPFEALTQGIVLNQVSFSYGDKKILSQLNITIPKHKTVALVGESGAGKSTLVDLITGILSPTEGTLWVDNIDLREINTLMYRQKIGYVTQEGIIFNDTVEHNISLWAQDDEGLAQKILRVGQQTHCDEFVSKMEQGYASPLGDRGVKLSGGQKQRITIARELFKEPEILILDEATSALDAETEKFIQQSIDELKGQLTVIIIAHRISTIKNSDYIYVLDQGNVLEEGTFNELKAQKHSKFHKMCEMQGV
ncbi:ABC transporter ATP-binding protein [Deltaproteobacteria bacterium TL4]